MPFSNRQVRKALESKLGFKPDPEGLISDFAR
jgi:hypothetical protein